MSLLVHEFRRPIEVHLIKINQTKLSSTTLSLEKDAVFTKNWSISIKQLCAPILDEEQAVLKLTDKKGEKEFICSFGSLGSRNIHNMRRRKSRLVSSTKQSYRAPLPLKLKEFVERIEQRIMKYQSKRKKLTQDKTSMVTMPDEGQHQQTNVNFSRSAIFGSEKWVQRSKLGSGSPRQYGQRKKERKLERMLHKYALDNSEDEEEKNHFSSNLKKGNLNAFRGDKIHGNIDDSADVVDAQEQTGKDSDNDGDVEYGSSDNDSMVSTLPSSKQKILSNRSEEKKVALPKRKKRRLQHNRKEELDDSDDDFGTPILVKELEDTGTPSEKDGLHHSFQIEPSNLSMDDVASATVTDDEDSSMIDAKEQKESKPAVSVLDNGIIKKTTIVSAEKQSKGLSKFFQPKRVFTKETNVSPKLCSQIDSHEHTEENDLQISSPKSLIKQEKATADPIQTQPKLTSHITLPVKSTPCPTNLHSSQKKATPPVKRALTRFFPTTVTPKKCSSPKSVHVRNPYKSPHHNLPSGLTNLGNTCYLNSSLQLLFSLPAFFESLLSFSAIKYTENIKDQIQQSSLLANVMKLYNNSQFRKSRGKVQSATQLKQCVDKLTKRFLGFEQRDAHEFLSDLIDLLHEEMDGSRNSERVILMDDSEHKSINAETTEEKKTEALATDEFFCMKVKVCLTCDHCKYTRSKEEIYRHLSLDVDTTQNDDQTTLEEGLKTFFAPEKREIVCEKCSEGKIATQTMEILKMPRALLLHLKRFIVLQPSSITSSLNQVAFRKNRITVQYPSQLQLDSHCSMKNSGRVKYQLRSLVHHIGRTAYCGHYTTDALRDGKWIRFDDGLAIEIKSEQVMGCGEAKKNAYMLLYELKE